MRTIYKGSLNFALLSIGVKVYKGTDESKVSFRQLHGECKNPVSLHRKCEACGKDDLEWKDLVKGYEIDEEHFVVFSDDEIASLTEEGSKSIRTTECVEKSMINLMAFSKFYYVVPEKGFERAYLLLKESLKRVDGVLVGNWVYHGKEYVVAVMPHENVMMMAALRYSEEINDVKELPTTPGFTKEMPSEEEIGLGVELIKKFMKKPGEWTLPDSSSFEEKFRELMNRKSLGGIIEAKTAAPVEAKPSNLMKELRASLDAAKSISELKVPRTLEDDKK